MKKLLAILVVTSIAFAAHSQLLWRISGGNCYKSSYMFGTIHLETSQFIDSVPGLSDAISSVDAIYGEVVKDELASKNAINKVLKESFAPADSTIDKLLSPDEYVMVDSVVRHYMRGLIGLDKLCRLKPIALALQLEVLQMAQYFPDFQAVASNGIDVAVQNRGAELGKYVGGFETIDEQMSIIYGNTLKEQARELVQMCAGDKEFGDYNRRLCELYHKQDLRGLEALLLDEKIGMGADGMERVSYVRNRKWMERIESTLPVQSMLIVVGAAHLVGKDGLIELLRSRGYVVEPVTTL